MIGKSLKFQDHKVIYKTGTVSQLCYTRYRYECSGTTQRNFFKSELHVIFNHYGTQGSHGWHEAL